jgi:two-component system response regulator PilR (NtrC family)
VLCATHKNLASEVERGAFRQDLFYRLNVIQINVPSLRERSEDIPIIIRAYMNELEKKWQMSLPSLSKHVMDMLTQYPYPGNVRELENILERAVTLCDGPIVDVEHLQLEISPLDAPRDGEDSEKRPSFEYVGDSLEDYLTDIEKTAILRTLEETRWNRTAAAKKLGMTFRSLRYRLKKLGLDADNDEAD